ncbi:hypothetical protein GCM10022198_02700 [Klugiella xanthotipulae]
MTWDYIDETSFDADTPDKAIAAAEGFLTLARDPQTRYEEDTSPAAVLISASECFYDGLEPLRAYEAAREAQDVEGEVAPDKRLYLIDALLRTGQTVEAGELAQAVWNEEILDPMVYSFLGDSYSSVNDVLAGQRWYDRGIRLIEKILEDADSFDRNELADIFESRELLLLGRQAVREDGGLPADRWDEEALEILAEYDEEADEQDTDADSIGPTTR